jgi:flagellar hook-length control protein FliK
MNVAPSNPAPLPVAARPDPSARASDPSNADSGTPADGFGQVLSKSLQGSASTPPNGSTPTNAAPADPKTSGPVPGDPSRATDPTKGAPGDDASAAAAVTMGGKMNVPMTTDLPADTKGASKPSDDDDARLASAMAALAAKTATSATQDANGAAGGTTAGTSAGATTDKTAGASTMGDKKDDDSAPDAAATDLAAQIALVSQWAALTPQTASTGVDSKANGSLRDKLDVVRSASTRSDAQAIDAAALKDTAATTTAAAAATVLERGLPTGATAAKTAGDVLKDALAGTTTGSKDTSMEKLIALAGGTALHAAADPSTNANFAQQMALHAASATATAVADAAPALGGTTAANGLNALHEQVGTPAWSHEVGQAALRMAANDLQNVSLKMNPEHLGPVDVQMRLDNGVAHIQFAAAHMDTRQALENSRPTLDNMFNQQGLKVGDWSVGQQSSGGSFARDFASANANGNGGSGNGSGGDDDGTITATVTTRTQRALGLVDTFA